MTHGRYILDANGDPVPCDDVVEWGRWFEASAKARSRVVAQDVDERNPAKTIMVSTVFLALDHNFGASGPPVLWETLVFGGPLDGEMVRYTSRADALRGHQRMCERVTASVMPPPRLTPDPEMPRYRPLSDAARGLHHGAGG